MATREAIRDSAASLQADQYYTTVHQKPHLPTGQSQMGMIKKLVRSVLQMSSVFDIEYDDYYYFGDDKSKKLLLMKKHEKTIKR